MIRQIGPHYQEASLTVLEERVHHLEMRVATLMDALRTLARGLEDSPMAEPGDRNVVEAARQAHELLLSADTPPAPGRGGKPQDTPPAPGRGGKPQDTPPSPGRGGRPHDAPPAGRGGRPQPGADGSRH